MNNGSTERTRSLKDGLREHVTENRTLISPGVAALGPAMVDRIATTLRVYDDFCRGDDIMGGHEFGSFEVEGHRLLFQIDYFDGSLELDPPDLPDRHVTTRVITIMLSDEY